MDQIFFQDTTVLIRTAIVGVCGYITLLAMVRLSGKRTLSKMNAFDLVVTVALGSTLASILTNRNVALAQGALAFGLLVGLQYLITWTSVRVNWVRSVVTGEPVLLWYRGEPLSAALRKERVTADEVRAAIRGAGGAAEQEIEAVVLETDGSFSVVQAKHPHAASSLEGIKRID